MAESRENHRTQRHFFDEALPALTEKAMQERPAARPTYDAILVDEGQDFTLRWWNVLRQACKSGGEMFLVADQTQHIYEHVTPWTDEAMSRAGFVGRWARLEHSYRMPQQMLPLLQDYLRRNLQDADPPQSPPQSGQLTLDGSLSSVDMQWLQADSVAEAIEASVELMANLPFAWQEKQITLSDITLLVDANQHGLTCVEKLAAEYQIQCAHTFAEEWPERQSRKMAFHCHDKRPKATTIDSFKGWESRAIILLLTKAVTAKDKARVYIGLSRLAWHPLGSAVIVVCAASELMEYGHTWPTFEVVQDASMHQYYPEEPADIDEDGYDGYETTDKLMHDFFGDDPTLIDAFWDSYDPD